MTSLFQSENLLVVAQNWNIGTKQEKNMDSQIDTKKKNKVKCKSNILGSNIEKGMWPHGSNLLSSVSSCAPERKILGSSISSL